MLLVYVNGVFFTLVVAKAISQNTFNVVVRFGSDDEYRDVVSLTVLYDRHVNLGETLKVDGMVMVSHLF